MKRLKIAPVRSHRRVLPHHRPWDREGWGALTELPLPPPVPQTCGVLLALVEGGLGHRELQTHLKPYLPALTVPVSVNGYSLSLNLTGIGIWTFLVQYTWLTFLSLP